MCGIFACVGRCRYAKEIVFEGLKKLEYRSYDSWGIAAKPLRGQALSIEKHVGKIGGVEVSRLENNLAMGHTHWATHGGATKANAHPHFDCTGLLVVVHNGIVENFQDIKLA